MASIISRTQNGIVFDNIDNTQGTLQLPLKITQTAESLEYKLLDAVNIDWNNAYLPNTCTYINTTGDLLSLLDSKIEELETQVDWEYYNENDDPAWEEYSTEDPTTEAPTTEQPPTDEP